MKKVIDYYTSHGSHVPVCFVDFSKAFDKVNYWTLFNKLLDNNVDCNIVALLAVWYSKQQACIQWKNTISCPFNIGNGTRQGGILSPYFSPVICVNYCVSSCVIIMVAILAVYFIIFGLC